MSTLIFLSGLGVPKILAKSSLVWNDPMWKGYRRTYITSRIPTSDVMVKHQLKKLKSFINVFPEPIVIGQSLGAWWAANLACEADCNIKKLVLTIPLENTKAYSIFNASPLFRPSNRIANKNLLGPHKTLVMTAKNDIIVPELIHAMPLVIQFNALTYCLDGGHLLQRDHQLGLEFIKTWIELG